MSVCSGLSCVSSFHVNLLRIKFSRGFEQSAVWSAVRRESSAGSAPIGENQIVTSALQAERATKTVGDERTNVRDRRSVLGTRSAAKIVDRWEILLDLAFSRKVSEESQSLEALGAL